MLRTFNRWTSQVSGLERDGPLFRDLSDYDLPQKSAFGDAGAGFRLILFKKLSNTPISGMSDFEKKLDKCSTR
jgi:hypothetical protein